jgi:hypothetical protein
MTVEMASDGGAAWRSETFAELEYMSTTFRPCRLPVEAALVMVNLTITNSTGNRPSIAKCFCFPPDARTQLGK